MSDELVDNEVPFTPRASAQGNRRVLKVANDAIGDDGEPVAAPAAGEPDEMREGGGRRFKESTEKLFAKLEGKDVGDEMPGETVVDDDGTTDTIAEAPTKPKAAAAPAAAPAEAPAEPPPEETPADPAPNAELDTIRGDYERVLETNRKLVAELDARRAPPKKAEPSAREKMLDEADRMYFEDPIGAHRRLIAVALGVDDPMHKDVTAELAGYYTDLTAQELGVPLETAHKAAREAARARNMLARDRRERKAESEQPKTPEETPGVDDTAAAQIIGSRLTAARADGKSFADEHPLVIRFSNRFDGMPPEQLLWRVIQREVRAGAISHMADTDALIAHAGKIIQKQYQGVVDDVEALKTKNDTAKTGETQATAIQASKDQRQSPGARAITNASASVAPASRPKTPPAPAQPGNAKKTRRDFPTDKAWKTYLLEKHFPD